MVLISGKRLVGKLGKNLGRMLGWKKLGLNVGLNLGF